MGGGSHPGIKAILVYFKNDLFSRSIKKNVQPNLKRVNYDLKFEKNKKNKTKPRKKKNL